MRWCRTALEVKINLSPKWGRVRPEDMSGNMCHAGGVTRPTGDWSSCVDTGLWLADADQCMSRQDVIMIQGAVPVMRVIPWHAIMTWDCLSRQPPWLIKLPVSCHNLTLKTRVLALCWHEQGVECTLQWDILFFASKIRLICVQLSRRTQRGIQRKCSK